MANELDLERFGVAVGELLKETFGAAAEFDRRCALPGYTAKDSKVSSAARTLAGIMLRAIDRAGTPSRDVDVISEHALRTFRGHPPVTRPAKTSAPPPPAETTGPKPGNPF